MGKLTFYSCLESDLDPNMRLKRRIRPLCLPCAGHSAQRCTCRSVNLDGEVTVLPDKPGRVDTSHISHKSSLRPSVHFSSSLSPSVISHELTW